MMACKSHTTHKPRSGEAQRWSRGVDLPWVASHATNPLLFHPPIPCSQACSWRTCIVAGLSALLCTVGELCVTGRNTLLQTQFQPAMQGDGELRKELPSARWFMTNWRMSFKGLTQDMIDRARTTLVKTKTLLCQLQAPAGLPVSSDADDPIYSSFVKTLEEWDQ